MSRVMRTVRHTITCTACPFTVSDSARVIVEQAWANHKQTTSHLYCTTSTVTTGETP